VSVSIGALETLYRKESEASLKERLLLVPKVEGDGMIPARVARSCTEAELGLLIGWHDIIKKVLMD
jgi:hypothetical protein